MYSWASRMPSLATTTAAAITSSAIPPRIRPSSLVTYSTAIQNSRNARSSVTARSERNVVVIARGARRRAGRPRCAILEPHVQRINRQLLETLGQRHHGQNLRERAARLGHVHDLAVAVESDQLVEVARQGRGLLVGHRLAAPRVDEDPQAGFLVHRHREPSVDDERAPGVFALGDQVLGLPVERALALDLTEPIGRLQAVVDDVAADQPLAALGARLEVAVLDSVGNVGTHSGPLTLRGLPYPHAPQYSTSPSRAMLSASSTALMASASRSARRMASAAAGRAMRNIRNATSVSTSNTISLVVLIPFSVVSTTSPVSSAIST